MFTITLDKVNSFHWECYFITSMVLFITLLSVHFHTELCSLFHLQCYFITFTVLLYETLECSMSF